MFLDLLRRRNPRLIDAAIDLHQRGELPANTYVLDLDAAKVNKDALQSGELQLRELDAEDRDIVHGLLVKHVEETDSQLAARLLENFDDTAARITKVLPRDYAAVLQTRLDAIEEGLDPDGEEVWSRILEVTGG